VQVVGVRSRVNKSMQKVGKGRKKISELVNT